MSLAFVDDRHALPDSVRGACVAAGDPAGGKAALLGAIGRALSLPPAVVDNLDAFYDALTDGAGTVAVLDGCIWWQAQPLLMARVSQCFVDVGERVSLIWVMTDEADARRWETGGQISGRTEP